MSPVDLVMGLDEWSGRVFVLQHLPEQRVRGLLLLALVRQQLFFQDTPYLLELGARSAKATVSTRKARA